MVTSSMRRLTLRQKRRQLEEEQTRNNRQRALLLLKEKQSYRAIHRATQLSMGTIGRLKKTMELAEKDSMPYDDYDYDLKRGRKPVLTYVEERAIVARLKVCESHGFAVSREALKSVAAEISNDEREGFPNGFPSDDWVRGFRARHRDITFRKMESRQGAKIAAENPEHVKTLVQALKYCEEQNPGILHDASCIWNMDETTVTINMTETEKGFVSADTNHGGQKMTCDSMGRHLTAVVIASAAGDVLPPFFIFAGCNNMDRWYHPLPASEFKDVGGVPHWLACQDWFPDDAFVTCSENGSMTQDLIPMVIEHIKKHAPKRSPEKKLLLLVDGHKSRNGHAWLSIAKESNIEVIQTPANTSHFLQACDQSINKQYKAAIRATFRTLGKMSFLDFGDMATKIKLGTAGFRALTGDIVRKSFDAVGLWPMDFRFLGWAEEKWSGVKSPENEAERRSVRVELRKQWKEMTHVFGQRRDISFKIDRLENIITAGNSRIQYILEKRTPTKVKVWKHPSDYYDRSTLSRGAPAVYLTHGQLIQKRREAQEAARIEKERKVKYKEETALKKIQAAEKRKQRKEELHEKKRKAAEEKERKMSERKAKKQKAETEKTLKKSAVRIEPDEVRKQSDNHKNGAIKCVRNVRLPLGDLNLNKSADTENAKALLRVDVDEEMLKENALPAEHLRKNATVTHVRGSSVGAKNMKNAKSHDGGGSGGGGSGGVGGGGGGGGGSGGGDGGNDQVAAHTLLRLHEVEEKSI